MRPRVFIASPYAGEVAINLAFARSCVVDSLRRGEAPFAPHLYLPQLLQDGDPEDRALGLEVGKIHLVACHLVAVYIDRGVSSGMKEEIAVASRFRVPTEVRIMDRLLDPDRWERGLDEVSKAMAAAVNPPAPLPPAWRASW